MFQIKHFVMFSSYMNLVGEGAKGKEDFLHKSYVIMEYNISIKMKVEGLYWSV